MALLLLAACSSIDCPLNNRVYATYKLAGSVLTLSDTLSVSTLRSQAEGDDTVLINRLVGSDSLSLPMSYTRSEDVLFFAFADTLGQTTIDTVRVGKENQAHFESVDCSPNYFHTITSVAYTRHKIDSIVIKNSSVTYNDSQPHFLLYLQADGD